MTATLSRAESTAALLDRAVEALTERFLRERYPRSALGRASGLEEACPAMERQLARLVESRYVSAMPGGRMRPTSSDA